LKKKVEGPKLKRRHELSHDLANQFMILKKKGSNISLSFIFGP